MVAAPLVIVSEELCETVDLRARQTVLDVATGNGNTALAAARRRCAVTGVDLVPKLLERARRRAEAEGLRVQFLEGDAERLAFPDASFDVALSTFGVMFAADPDRAASELLRVCRPGGSIGLANWVDQGFTGSLLAEVARRLPPSLGLSRMMEWGFAEGLERLIGASVERLSLKPRTVRLRADSVESLVGGLERFLSPVVVAYRALPEEERMRFHDDLLRRVRAANRAMDGSVLVESDYVEVVARRRSDGNGPKQAI